MDGIDYISDLPQSIIETILTKLPISDAVKTSALSTKWRYKWSTLTQIVFDDKCLSNLPSNGSNVEDHISTFITYVLFLHNGPIHKFQLSTSILQTCPDIDQWLLFLSRTEIKELILELGEGDLHRVPSCLFNCCRLTRLELFRCELDLPVGFKGFLGLKSLSLLQVLILPDAVEDLISSCPVLETLSLSYFECLELHVRAPNLKYLCLEGEFRDVFLENTPLLISVSMTMYMKEDISEHFEQSLSCNFVKFFGGVPCLERLVGHVYFTKYLSIGYDLDRRSITFNHLKSIELNQVSFEDIKEIMVVLCIVMNSPNLLELTISVSSTTLAGAEDCNLDSWRVQCPSDRTLELLRSVKMTDISGMLYEMEFIRFVLQNSPVLESLSIAPSAYVKDERLKMLIELLRMRRASTKAEIIFIPD